MGLTAIIGLVEWLVWAGLGIAKVWFGADPMRKALIIYAADNFGSITLALVTTAYVVFTYHDKVVADANVSRAGKLTGVWTGLEALEPYAHGGAASVLTSW